MNPIVYLAYQIINLYSFVVFIWLILSMLVSFRVLKLSHPIVLALYDGLGRMVEPVIAYIRRYVPPFNGLDLAALVLLIGLNFLSYCLVYFFG
jgi:YggT family protein